MGGVPSPSYFSNMTLALTNLLKLDTKLKEELFRTDDPWQRMIACSEFLKNVNERSEPSVVFVTHDYSTTNYNKLVVILGIVIAIMLIINRFLS